MAFIAAVVAFLALLSCAGAQAPAPAPLQQKTPVPMQQSAPTPALLGAQAPAPAPLQQKTPVPVQQSAPTPALLGAQAPAPASLQQKTPVPVQQSAPTPVLLGAQAPAPAPLQQKTPVPVQQSAPTPAPPQKAAPAPTLSVGSPKGSPGTAAPPPTLYVGSPEGSPGTAAPAPTFDVGSPEGASPPSSDCLNSLTNLSACLTYVMAGSNLTVPDEGCCPGLAGLVESNPICLCQLFGSSNSLGITLDTAKALKLPSVCKVSTPPLSTCALIGIPVGAPGISQMAPVGEPSTAIASPPESSKSSSSFRISITVSLIGLWAGVAAIF